MAISSRNLCRSLVTQEPKGEEQALILDAVSKNTREAQILPSQNSPGHNVKPAPLGPVAHPSRAEAPLVGGSPSVFIGTRRNQNVVSNLLISKST